jgi:hypothetical protein
VNRELNIVRGCFSRAVKWGRLAVSPLHAVQSYKVDDCRIRVLSDDELRLVLSAPPFVALGLSGDARLPESHQRSPGAAPRTSGSWMELRRKGGRVHRIALPDDLRTPLLVRCHASGYTFGEGPTGEPPSQQTASNRVLRALAALGLSGVTHHTMRHTGVTLMLEAGVNPRAIQTLAGWTTLRMLERYGHARDAEMRRALLANADYLQQVATKTATAGDGEGADSHEPRGGKVIQSE